MKNTVISVDLEGVICKDYNTSMDLKICNRTEMEKDEDFKYIYIIKEGPVVLPGLYVKKGNILYDTGVDVCKILNEK